MLSQQLTSTPRSLSTKLLSSHSSPNLYLCPVLFHPRCRAQHSLFSTLCHRCLPNLPKSFYALRQPTAPPHLVSSAILLSIHATPEARSLVKMSSKTDRRLMIQTLIPLLEQTLHLPRALCWPSGTENPTQVRQFNGRMDMSMLHAVYIPLCQHKEGREKQSLTDPCRHEISALNGLTNSCWTPDFSQEGGELQGIWSCL